MFSIVFATGCASLFSLGLGQEQVPDTAPPLTPAVQVPPPVMNQPVVVGSFENVEMERLRLARESADLAREETAYREQVLLLQQKLARASLSVLPSEQLPVGFWNDFRAFLSSNEGDVARSNEYYRLLTATLSDLIPQNPYAEQVGAGEPNVVQAEKKLSRLLRFPEDEGISRNIMAQVSAVRGGVHETDQRRRDVRAELTAIEKRKRQLLHNIGIASEPSALSGRPSIGASSIPAYREELRLLEERAVELKAEGQGLAPTLQKATRELQFQQFIIELAFQQRYVHSLIACGFYRFYSRNMMIAREAYPQQGGDQATSGQGPVSSGATGDSQLVPFIANVPALETFLMNRIVDATKDREAVDNMLASNQLSAAENVIRELVLTAKYQPDLHTIPHESRQRVLAFSEGIRQLSDALHTQNYAEIGRLAAEIEQMSSDPGMADVKSFAEEHPRKAMNWARRAEVALKVGDHAAMRALMEAAQNRAPHDASVERVIRGLEADILAGGEKKKELERLVETGDYREVYRRKDDFAAFASSGDDPALRSGFEALMEKERKVQEILKKCDEFEARSSYPDAWITLSDADAELKGDQRLRDRREQVGRRCQAFNIAYETAKEQENAGRPSLALAWYLSALVDAPTAGAILKPRMESLAGKLLNE